jgi:hypothetical protein
MLAAEPAGIFTLLSKQSTMTKVGWILIPIILVFGKEPGLA